MEYEPESEDEDFNEWYREFHLLFEDSYRDREQAMEIAQACFDRAKAFAEPVAVPLLTSSHHSDDLLGAMAAALCAIHKGEPFQAGLRFSEELARRCYARFDKEITS